MPGRIYTTITSVNGVSIYAMNGSPNGVLSAARGSICSDKLTGDIYANTDGATTWAVLGGGGAGVIRQFTWLSGAVDNAAEGLFGTFVNAYAAALAATTACEGDVTLYVRGDADNDVTIETLGAYDMARIPLVGVSAEDDASRVLLRVPTGVTFSNLAQMSNLTLRYEGGAGDAMISVATGLVGLVWNWGPNLRVLSFGGGGVVLEVTGAGAHEINLLDDSVMEVGDGAGFVVDVQDTVIFLLNMFSKTVAQDEVIQAAVGTQVYITREGSSSFGTQSSILTATYFVTTGSIPYTPAVPGNWGSSPPSTTGAALDQLIAGSAGYGSAYWTIGFVQPVLGASGLTKTGLAANCTNVEFAWNIGGGSYGPQNQQVTDAVLNDEVYIYETAASDFQRAGQPLYVDVFSSDDWTSQRFFSGWIGAAGIGILAADNPAGQQTGIQFSTARGDVNFQFAFRNAGAQVLVNTGIPPVANTIYKFVADLSDTRAVLSLYEVASGGAMTNTLLFQSTYTTMGDVLSTGSWISGTRTLAAAQRGLYRHQTYVVGSRFTAIP